MAMLLSLAMLAGCSSADPNHPYEKEPLPANNSEAEPEETSSVPLFEGCSEQREAYTARQIFCRAVYLSYSFSRKTPMTRAGRQRDQS